MRVTWFEPPDNVGTRRAVQYQGLTSTTLYSPGSVNLWKLSYCSITIPHTRGIRYSG